MATALGQKGENSAPPEDAASFEAGSAAEGFDVSAWSSQFYPTGARRLPEDGRGRFDLLPPLALMRLARRYELGAAKYGERNWENGIPASRCISAALRHLMQYMAGETDEDHLAAVAWNVLAVMEYEEQLAGVVGMRRNYILNLPRHMEDK